MPWCPNCKAEYQDGFTECSDCKVTLVDDIKEAEPLIPFFQAEDKNVAEKLVKFFNYSDLNSTCEFDAETGLYIVSIPPKGQMQAKKLYQAFYFVERERMEKGETDLLDSQVASKVTDTEKVTEDTNASASGATEEESEVDHPSMEEAEEPADSDDYKSETPGDEINAFDDDKEQSSVYVMKADQYKDLSGTVWIFLFFGVIGLIVVILNVVGIFSFFNGWIPNTVMGVLFALFIYIAISTNQKAKKVQVEIDAENKLTEQINEWLKQNITESFLASIHDEKLSEELNYIRKTDTIKEMLMKEFGTQNLAYLDRLIEEYYSNNFDE